MQEVEAKPFQFDESKEEIEKMVSDLAECHTEVSLRGALLTDYEATARKMTDKGYRKQIEGEWRSELIRRCDWKGKEQQYFQPNSCSICHNAVATRTPFCPKCGAKMRKEDEGK